MKKKYTTIRQLKQRLANFARTRYMRDEDAAGKSREEILTEKCRIINEQLYGEDQSEWLNPDDLLENLKSYAVSGYGKSNAIKGIASELHHILYYLTKDYYDYNDHLDSIAVYDLAKKLGTILRGMKKTRDERRSNIDNTWLDKETYLTRAVKDNDVKEVKLLIRKGADVNCTDDTGHTPLELAIKAGNEEIIDLLLNAGADVNHTGYQNVSMLMKFAESGDLDSVKTLVSLGADVNAQDQNWNNALMYAVRGDEADVAKYLLKHGAKNSANRNKETPSMVANSRGKPELISLFKAGSTADHKTALLNLDGAIISENLEGIKDALDSGAGIDERYHESYTPLLTALISSKPKSAMFLIKQGADVNLALDNGQTPLRWAKARGYDDVVRELEKRGAK